MLVSFKNSRNTHLKILDSSIEYLVNEIIINILRTKETVRVINVGGGYVKPVESFLSSHPSVDYYCLDIDTTRLSASKNIIQGDITSSELSIDQKFDFIYTKDTFEHILNPWDATRNIKNLLNQNGYILCIAPFSWRYHACPLDTYRYTHTGLRYIFERLNSIEHIFSGYIKLRPNRGWYKSKTDVTLDGSDFTENIETIYVGKKNNSHIFNIKSLDLDEEEH
jgi:hypothetical protein